MVPTIFVIDDDKTVRAAIVARLVRQRYRVLGFESDEETLNYLQYEMPQVILLDFKHPANQQRPR